MNNSINWLEIILSSALISGIIAAIVNQFFYWLNGERQDEKQRYQKLYGPLKFHFMYLKSIDKHRARIIEAGKEGDKDAQKILDRQRNIEERNQNISSQLSAQNKLVTPWWKTIDKIYNLLENNPDMIRKGDLQCISNFIDAYISTEYLGKDMQTKMSVYLFFKLNEQRSSMNKSVEALSKKVLNDHE